MKLTERRVRALARLEEQLRSGVKTDKDQERIKKEILTLKARI